MSTDIVIPLGNGSKSNNDELRILLRSIEKYAIGYDRIWIVTSTPPEWLKQDSQLVILYHDDIIRHNKDANIFEKIKLALDVTSATNILYTADDRAILMPINLSKLPPIYNARKFDDFIKKPPTRWQRRLAITLKEINLMDGNFDSHTPQLWNVQEARLALKDIPYKLPEGRCINSAIMGRIYKSKIPSNAILQQRIKETAENKDLSKIKLNRCFIGYNDTAFLNGLREKLFTIFLTPCKWEK